MRKALKLLTAGSAAVLVAVVLMTSSTGTDAVSSVSAAPSADYFLKLEGIDGNSTAIEVLSWSWGMSNSRDVGSGQSTGKRQYQPIIIRKNIDKTSPLLSRTANDGTQIKKLVLTGQTADKKKYQISFFDVFIEEYENSGEQGSPPSENVSFNYQKIEFDY